MRFRSGTRRVCRSAVQGSGRVRGGNAAGGPGKGNMNSEILNEILGLARIQTVCIVILLAAVLFMAWLWYEDTWRM